MECPFQWPKTALLGVILGAYLSACSTNSPEPNGNNLPVRKAASDSTVILEAPPKNVNGGG